MTVRDPGRGVRALGPRAAARFPCFDGIRAVAALAVIVFHAVYFCTGFKGLGGRYLGNLDVGVSVFFVTSGFLLYRPFAVAHLTGGASPGLRSYALRRIARIYPAYWVALAFFTVVVHEAVVRGDRNIVLDATLTYTYAGQDLGQLYQGLPVAWSLVVEVSFYLFLPFYAAAIGAAARRLSPRRVSPVTAELVGLTVLGLVGVTSLLLFVAGNAPLWMSVLPLRLHVFGLVMLLAVIASRPWGQRATALLSRAGEVPWLWWALALVAFLALPTIGGINRSADEQVAGDLGRALIGFLVVVPAVVGARRGGSIRSLLRSPLMAFLGLVSYGLYLWHFFLLLMVQRWLGWRPGTGNWVALLAVSTPVIVAAAAASWYLVERRIIGLASRMSSPSPVSAASISSPRSSVAPPRVESLRE